MTETYWFVLMIKEGLTYPPEPGPVRYKAPDTMRWAITKADTRKEAVERAKEGSDLVPYAVARLMDYERVSEPGDVT